MPLFFLTQWRLNVLVKPDGHVLTGLKILNRCRVNAITLFQLQAWLQQVKVWSQPRYNWHTKQHNQYSEYKILPFVVFLLVQTPGFIAHRLSCLWNTIYRVLYRVPDKELPAVTLQWRHNEHDGVSNHQPRDCLLNRLFRHRLEKTSKLRVTGLCAGNSPVAGEFTAQMASNAENVSIWWRHRKLHDIHLPRS